jgi:hypothetical protein
MPICPFCRCRDRCNREPGGFDRAPSSSWLIEVYNALIGLFSIHPELTDEDPLLLQQELIYYGRFSEESVPTLSAIGHCQDLIREVER